MAPTQPFPQVPRPVAVALLLRSLAQTCVAVAACALLLPSMARAQGDVPLVTVATDQSSLDLSNQFGVPAGSAVNQAGDFAFVGHGDTALFFRAAGAASVARVLQSRDAVPGVPGSRISYFWPSVALNGSRVLLFEVSYETAEGKGRVSLVTYDGTNFKIRISSDDIAPGASGATYGADLRIGGINDHGDVSFSTLTVSTSVTTAGTAIIEVSTFYILKLTTVAGSKLPLVRPNAPPLAPRSNTMGSNNSGGSAPTGMPRGPASFTVNGISGTTTISTAVNVTVQ